MSATDSGAYGARPIPEWAEPVIALGENVQQGRCDTCGLHVWLWLCVRYDDDGERHQPRCDERKAAAAAWLTALASGDSGASS